MADISDLVHGFDLVPLRLPREQMEAEVTRRIAVSGHLGADDVAFLRERTGWSRASIFRVADAVRPQSPEFGPDATFLDRIQLLGQAGFEFDDLALGMLAAHGRNMSAFRNDVISYGEANGLALEMPSLAQLSRRRQREVSTQVWNGLRYGHKNRYATTLRMRWEAEYVNQMCQMDEFILDLACLAPADDRESDFVDDNGDPLDPVKVYVGDTTRWMVPIRARLLLLEEAKSRMISAFAVLSQPPTAVDTLALLADGIDVRRAENGADALIGGAFDVLVSDNAPCFRAQVVSAGLEGVGAELDIAVGFDPVGKAKVERAGDTIQRKIVVGLPGHLSRMETRSGRDMLGVSAVHLLPFDQVVAIAHRAVYEHNYQDRHSSLGTTPFQAFVDGCPNPRKVPDEVLAPLFLPGPRDGGSRKVLNDGLQVFNRRGYLAPELAQPGIFGEKVQVRVLHHRRDKIAVFKPLARRVDPEAAEFIAMADDCSKISKTKRIQIMRAWQVGAATVDRAAGTAHLLRNISAETVGAAGVSLTAAAFTEQERRDAVASPAAAPTEDLKDPDTPPAKKVDPARRPATTRRVKLTVDDTAPVIGAGTRANAELDALEANLDRSLSDGDQDPEAHP